MEDNTEVTSDRPIETRSRRASILAILSSQWGSLLILCALITAVISITSEGNTENLGYLFGYYLMHALVTAVIFIAVRRPPLKFVNKLLAFLALLMSFIAGDLIAYHINIHSIIGSKNELTETLDWVIALGASVGTGGNERENERDRGDRSSAILPAFLERIAKETLASKQEYERTLETGKWPILLDPDRIRRDRDGSETVQIASDAMLALTKHRTRMVALYERIPEDAAATALPSKVKAQFIEGIQKSLPSSRAEMLQALDSEQSMIDSYTSMAQFLRLRRGRWEIQDEILVFSNQKDLDDYSKLVEKAENAAAVQERIKNQSESTLRALQKNMEAAFK